MPIVKVLQQRLLDHSNMTYIQVNYIIQDFSTQNKIYIMKGVNTESTCKVIVQNILIGQVIYLNYLEIELSSQHNLHHGTKKMYFVISRDVL